MEKDTAVERYFRRETLQIYLFQNNSFLKFAEFQLFFFFLCKNTKLSFIIPR